MASIAQLTPEQEAVIPVYRDRWWQIALSTTAIDYGKAEVAVKAAYAAMGKPSPHVLFFNGPQEARDTLGQKTIVELLAEMGAPLLQMSLTADLSAQLRSHLSPDLLPNLVEQLQSQRLEQLTLRLQQATFWSQLADLLEQQQAEVQFGEQLFDQLITQFWEQQQTEWRRQMLDQPTGQFLIQVGDSIGQWLKPLDQTLQEHLWQPLRSQPLFHEWERNSRQMMGVISFFGLGFNALRQTVDMFHGGMLDFCFSVLRCPHDEQKWQIARSLMTECGLFMMFEKACLVLNRPLQIAVDPEGRLHAEGEAAVRFADGFHLYFYRDVMLPERYGMVHPNQWSAQWLLQETNAELRRVLIQGIGYSRLCQELHATALDTWREYTLLRIDQSVDVEPVFLLKMTCPSTGYIHATRVPPTMRTAREAICWVNWDVDPETFAIET